jgi:hypothetical protein
MDTIVKLDLVKQSEVAATEFQCKFLNLPVFHQIFAHSRSYLMMAGVMSLFVGIGLVGFSMSWAGSTARLCFLLGVLVETMMVFWMVVPCKCGKVPALTAKARFDIMRLRNKSYVVTTVCVAGVIGVIIDLLGFGVVGAHNMLVVTSWFLVLFGCFAFFLGLVSKTEWYLNRTIVPEHEQREIAILKGETEEELQKLVEFHLKLGNFSEADEYSRKHLALAENVSV